MTASPTITTLSPGRKSKAKVTGYLLLVCVVAASGGLIYGYEIGVTGGVTAMDNFLTKFFPKLDARKPTTHSYCGYNDQSLQLFTSSLFLAGLTGSFCASWTTQHWGRRPSMLIGGICCLTGAMLNGIALELVMLIAGRIALGIGIGFASQAVPLYLSEMAPAHLRGALNICFQLATTIGILVASVINYGAGQKTIELWGWRLSLGFAAVPAAILILGGISVSETPNNLIERNKYDKGKATLKRIRGTENVDEEFDEIVIASHEAHSIKNPLRNLISRKHRPQLCIAILIPFFQQVTGINAIMFYAPVLFVALGFGSEAALYSSVITGAVNVLSTFVSIATVDRLGRKVLFWQGGAQMFLSQIVIGCILKFFYHDGQLPKAWGVTVVICICIYVAAFAWSWGPLGWLVPSEVFPLEIRSAAQGVTVFVNFFCSFFLGQVFLSMLCFLQWGIFLFFGGWVLIMTHFITFFLPETKNIPIEEMDLVWGNHWYWKRFVGEPDFVANDFAAKDLAAKPGSDHDHESSRHENGNNYAAKPGRLHGHESSRPENSNIHGRPYFAEPTSRSSRHENGNTCGRSNFGP